MPEAVEAVADGLSEVAALMGSHHCETNGGLLPLVSDGVTTQRSEKTVLGEKHKISFVLCVRSTIEFDIVCNIFNGLEEFVLV